MSQTRRRRFVVALGASALASPIFAVAQQVTKVPRIGALTVLSTVAAQSVRRALTEAFGRAGYTVGRNILLEWRFADGEFERLPKLADDLVRRNVNVIVAIGDRAIDAAVHATKRIPIVMQSYTKNPVKEGLAASLARPGGNVTGNTWAPDLIALVTKQYEILKAAAPTAVRVGSLWHPWTTGAEKLVDEMHDRINKGLSLVVTSFVPRNADDFPSVLKRIAAFKPDALYVCSCPIVNEHLGEIAAFTAQQKLVSLGNASVYVKSGGLLSYAIDSADLFNRVVSFVDRILRGAKPGDLPIEQPSRFELLFNGKTARAMGYTLPAQLQLRVDQVIDE